MVQALRNIGGGLVASLLLLATAFSNGALIFTGPLQPFLGEGVTAALITTAVTTIFVALTCNFPSAVAGPTGNTAALLAAAMVTLGPVLSAMPPPQALALVVACLGAAALLTGLALFALGWRRLGKMVRFVPYPVVAGFLAATGFLIVSGAVRMATGVPLTRSTLGSFAEPHTALLLGITALWAAALWLLTGRFKNPLTLPLSLVTAIVLVHAVLAVLHLAQDAVHQSGLMFAASADSHPVIPLITGEYLRADWFALWPVAGDLVSVAVMAILGVLLNFTVLELATGIDADIDREQDAGAGQCRFSLGWWFRRHRCSKQHLDQPSGGRYRATLWCGSRVGCLGCVVRRHTSHRLCAPVRPWRIADPDWRQIHLGAGRP
jgi:sulfate permease, SulP family